MILLREAREEAGLTQKQLAELSNVPQQTISAIESGNRIPGADTLYNLASALHKRMDDLYKRARTAKGGRDMMCDNGKQYEHIRLTVDGNPDIWFRRRCDQTEKAEIITADKGVIEVLNGLAKESPEIISILTEEDEEQLHAIVGKELVIEIRPSDGSISFWTEKAELTE